MKVTRKVTRFGDYVTSLNEGITKDAYLSEATKKALQEARDICIKNIDITEANKDALEVEIGFMKNDARKIVADDNISEMAKDVAGVYSAFDNDKYAQVLLFKCLSEMSSITLTSNDEYTISCVEEMFEVIELENNTPKGIIKNIREKTDPNFNQKALHSLRKARISGNVEKVLDAIAGVLSLSVGGNASDLNTKLHLDGGK